jgi:hypothetical protein
MKADNQIQITLLKLKSGLRLLRLTDPESGLSLEKLIDPQRPLVRQKQQLLALFGVTLSRQDVLTA